MFLTFLLFLKNSRMTLWNAGMVSVPLGHWLSLGFHLSPLESLITPMLWPLPQSAWSILVWGCGQRPRRPSGPSTWGGVNHEDLETRERRWSTSVMLHGSQPTCSWMWTAQCKMNTPHVLTRLCVSIQLLPALIPRHHSVLAAYGSRNSQRDFIVFSEILRQRHVCAALSSGRCGRWLT